jgi:phospholipid-translocating ATPase
MIIYAQMFYFSNQFYICLLVTQMIDVLRVGFIADFITPVAIVFLTTFVKEGFDDYHRWKKDLEANKQEIR